MVTILLLLGVIEGAQQPSQENEILLVVEVVRHGQRAPEKIFPFAKNPDENFKIPHNLTMTGAVNHHESGKTLRKVLTNLHPGFLSEKYDKNEVYV